MNKATHHQPPRIAQRLLERFVDDRWWQELTGDLEEQFEDNLELKGLRKARFIYWMEVLRLLRPHILKRSKRNNFVMLSFNHIKISYRNLLRNKVFAFVNILGLSVGIASVMLIGIYVNYETSYDKFFDDSDRIHRIALNRIYPTRSKLFGTSSVMLAPTLNNNYPQVEKATRLHRLFFNNEIEVTITENNESFIETKFLFADSAYFDVFSYEFLAGNPRDALTQLDGVVLTRSTAERYFGTSDVLGKTINANGGPLNVTGVIEDIPANSHIHFDLLGSVFTLPFITNSINTDNWINMWVYTYAKLKEGVDPDTFEGLLPDLVDTYGGASIAQSSGANWKEEGHAFDYFLQPIESIHLKSKLDVEVEPNSDIAYVYIISAIAIVILIISTINFINLSVARSTERAKEVGIRKVVGSNRSSLISQFLTEAIFVCFISAVVSLGIVLVVIPKFNQVLGTALDFAVLYNPLVILSLLAFIIIVGLISGMYPALVISGIKPAKVLKGNYKSSGKGVWLRNALITLQFVISIVMISGSIIIGQQMSFLRNKDLGFNKENLMVAKQTFQLGADYNAFKNELMNMAEVENVGGSIYMPGDFHGSGVFEILDSEIPDIRVNTLTVDVDYIKTLQFEVIAGRDFDRNFNDSLSIIVNQAFVDAMGVEDAIGMKIQSTGGAALGSNPVGIIIGVVADYNFYSLHSEIGPVVISEGQGQFTPPITAIRISTNDLSGTITRIEEKWAQFTDENFNFSFLTDDLDSQYEADRNSASIFDVFTIVAIIMSCVGLFGLATYVVNQRIKEMSIRKVLGASLPNLIKVFTKEFLLLTAIAFVLATPISFFALKNWLTNFAYHINIGVLAFLIAGSVTLVLVFITISYQAIKVAVLNPSRTLRMD